MKNNRIITWVEKHIKEHIFIYALVILCFLIGISVGAFTVKALDVHQKQELVSYLKGFFQLFDANELNGVTIFKQSFTNNFQLLALNWILGITVIGIPFVFMIVGFKGFVIGFTVGVLIEEFKMIGFLLFLFAIFPQNILIIGIFILSGVISTSFTVRLIKSKVNKVRNFSFGKQFIQYSILNLILFGLIIIPGLIEAFLAPIFIRLISRYI
ncbi:Sporulation stage II, protein M [Alkaliphilus metalliredigens QYMF]|uniref:Sporulation stage II, protein M n=1 Tax=Alkaliphilus metalliredigens (strain QYMF) TaxID=293826 RepID=A6TR57_ALKMQ|nr:stage II sporulation protein M [Alkaliphilus metalliredigens]ABR48675.1 Sporulation stage II, protein M [Alkaliphilus metalliredigens QYMF]